RSLYQMQPRRRIPLEHETTVLRYHVAHATWPTTLKEKMKHWCLASWLLFFKILNECKNGQTGVGTIRQLLYVPPSVPFSSSSCQISNHRKNIKSAVADCKRYNSADEKPSRILFEE